ncbi:MAG: iron ABC transporter permease [Treponema sp.]|jgi:iron complex transport system permease protein|nr:iron ABC transporter permease [Treponema sp.]
MSKQARIILVLAALLAAAILASLLTGRYPIPLSALWQRIVYGSFPKPQMEAVFFTVRLPRVLMAILAGAALAAAGASFQGVFQNPLASPDMLGASSGAATGAALAILLRLPSILVTASAFAMSLITIAVVMLLGEKVRSKKIIALVLAGLMISSMHNAAVSWMKLIADTHNTLPEIVFWLMGSLAKVRPVEIKFTIIPMIAGLVMLFICRWKINHLTFSDDEARSMGVNVKSTRALVIVSSTLITAAAVSVCGIIGWAGLVVPHICRKLTGNNYLTLMPSSMIAGALFLLVIDNISRNLFSAEIPLGILTSLFGAPFFLWLVTRKGDIW